MAAIIGAKYCNANATDIGVLRSVLPIGEKKRQFVVADINNNVIFRVKDTSTFFHKQKTLLDSNGTPIVTFRPKDMTQHCRWRAFKGESTNKKDLIFSVKQSSWITHSSNDLHIYLANNKDEKTYDYVVDSSFVFYKRHFDNFVIAETKEHMVKVSENVDMAFIVSLIVILDGMREEAAENAEWMASAQQRSRDNQANMAMAM